MHLAILSSAVSITNTCHIGVIGYISINIDGRAKDRKQCRVTWYRTMNHLENVLAISAVLHVCRLIKICADYFHIVEQCAHIYSPTNNPLLYFLLDGIQADATQYILALLRPVCHHII